MKNYNRPPGYLQLFQFIQNPFDGSIKLKYNQDERFYGFERSKKEFQ